MTLRLNVKSYQRLSPAQEASKCFEEGTLTIGRSPENDWVLPDPERIISKRHCTIEFTNGAYILTDTSTNGVYVNNLDFPLGKGKSVQLHHGDQVRLGNYEIEVGLDTQAEPTTPPYDRSIVENSFSGELPGPNDDFVTTEEPPELIGDLGPADAWEPSAQRDPGEVLPSADSFFEEDVLEPSDSSEPPEQDHLPPERQYFQPPKMTAPEAVEEQIPSDWDEKWDKGGDDSYGSEAMPQPAPPTASEPPPPALEPRDSRGANKVSAEQFMASSSREADRSAIQAFLSGAALSGLKIPEDQVPELMETLGEIFREIVQGLREVLAARNSIKNEFRLSQTTIQPAENNPLKFSVNVEDAMITLLTKGGKGYVGPLPALKEAIGDIKAHQLAVMAGMQMALTELLRSFDPKTLEERMGQDSHLGGIFAAKGKAKYWDAFNQLYESIAKDAEDHFHSQFGREFAKAYEEQIRRHRDQER